MKGSITKTEQMMPACVLACRSACFQATQAYDGQQLKSKGFGFTEKELGEGQGDVQRGVRRNASNRASRTTSRFRFGEVTGCEWGGQSQPNRLVYESSPPSNLRIALISSRLPLASHRQPSLRTSPSPPHLKVFH